MTFLNKIKKIYHQNKYLIFIFIIVLMIFSIWINNKYYAGHDTVSHFSNIYALSTTININNPFGSEIYPFVANGFGYGTGIFYPNLADYIPALIFKIISLLTSNVFYGIKIYYFLVTLLAAITMYFLSNKIFKNKEHAFLSSIMYIFMPYFLSDIFVRDAMGETMIFFVVPLAFLGLYELFDHKYKLFLLYFVSAYFIGMNSHLVLMIYITFFLIIFLLFNIKKILNKQSIIYLCIASFLILIFSSPYLITLIEHKLVGNYVVFSPNSMATVDSLKYESVELSAYFLQRIHHHNICLCINIVTILLFVFTILAFKKLNLKSTEKNIIKYSLVTIGLLVFIMSPIMFWDKVPIFLLSIQFPWRLEVFLVFLLALISPLGLNVINSKKLYKFMIIYISLLIVISGIASRHLNNKLELKPDEYDWNLAMGWQKEYLPVNTANNLEYFYLRNNTIKVLEGKADIKIISNEISDFKFKVNNLTTDNVVLELPRIYYLGYTLKNDKDQNFIYKENDKGFITINLEEEGLYEFYYTGTKNATMAKYFIIVTGCVIIGFVIKNKYIDEPKVSKIKPKQKSLKK